MQEHNFQETAWLVGVDHAKFNLRRDASAPQAFLEGYDSWTGRKKKADVFVRKWLYLRLSAIKRQRILTSDVSPQFLREIVSPVCPVSLTPLTTGSDGKTNWSVDRLENSGAYAVGNVVVLSQRVNEAKGELSFQEVSDIATRGETINGLTGVEWMRLISLMYGAWSVNSGTGDKYILPQATEFPRHLFHTTSQVVQLYVLRHITEPKIADTGEIWRAITHKTHGNTAPFEQLLNAIKQELPDQTYPLLIKAVSARIPVPNHWSIKSVTQVLQVPFESCERYFQLVEELIYRHNLAVIEHPVNFVEPFSTVHHLFL